MRHGNNPREPTPAASASPSPRPRGPFPPAQGGIEQAQHEQEAFDQAQALEPVSAKAQALEQEPGAKTACK